jgi:predicted DNA-binding WGR domain protein
MRTFQFSDATSHKFWNIEISGSRFTVTDGKVGSSGQS